MNYITNIGKTNGKLVQNRYKNMAYLIPFKNLYVFMGTSETLINKGN